MSILDHSLQAAHFTKQELDINTIDNELIVANLLHDIGHALGLEVNDKEVPTMAHCGVVNHEGIGADFLRKLGFNERVCRLTQAHVQAKR